ncbi:MAG: YgiT-type zinc finger protein [Candidatus Riflebacteria bacterium]|nr:YgiT-type zinc finger protein [Candidatus Riflebacteria bacterium]
MKCPFCPGELKKGTIPFHIDRKGIHVTLDSVPALICQLCGQSLFEESEMKTIDEVVTALDKRSKKLERAA